MTTKTIAAGAFKQGCLALLDEVADGDVELIVTKRGRPVARIVPVKDAREHEASTLERMRRQMRVRAEDKELIEPSSRSVRWRHLPKARRP